VQHAEDGEMTKEELIAFEEDIAAVFNEGKIRAPVHLYFGNEEEMIGVFRAIRPQDWVFCSWRSHYQCLLKGVPKEAVREEILAFIPRPLSAVYCRLRSGPPCRFSGAARIPRCTAF
jgi:hypothetical protein